ncbi:MAG: hypothetical protein M3Y07_09750, partial [Acidobacteriota bacterium]|nr:hypothetical protein [Acidobacteriota bacterium]
AGAYNLVRAVMSMAAQRHKIEARQLSFSGVLKLAAQCKLPKRHNRRSYPRATWRRQTGFPFRKEGEK